MKTEANAEKQIIIKNQPTPYSIYTWQTKLLSGAVIGLANSTAVTPVVNYTNHVMNRCASTHKDAIKFTCARAFDGLAMYNVSFVLRISVALSLDSLFLNHINHQGEIEKKHTLISSILSGGIAGSVATLPEAIAQTQQLCKQKPSARSIISNAYHSNGFFSLSRGMPEMVVRTAGLTVGYLALMPPLCQQMRHEMGDHWIADVFSAMVCGLLVGVITTPPNNVRFDRQQSFSEKGPAPTYSQIWKDKCATQDGTQRLGVGVNRLFVGLKPQTLRCMLSMYIITEGNKLCLLFSEDGFPDFPSLKLK